MEKLILINLDVIFKGVQDANLAQSQKYLSTIWSL